MMLVGIALAVGLELTIRVLKELYVGAPITPSTFLGALAFIAAIANYVYKPMITYVFLAFIY